MIYMNNIYHNNNMNTNAETDVLSQKNNVAVLGYRYRPTFTSKIKTVFTY